MFPYMRDIGLVLGFLTRVKMPNSCFKDDRRLMQAGWAFPIAGIIISLPAALILWLGFLGSVPSFISSTLAVASLIILTGALHEDGLADCADGFFGSNDRDTKIEIMKDSRIGTYGTLALLLITLLRIQCISSLGWPDGIFWLIAACCASRTAMLIPALALPIAKENGAAAHAGNMHGLGFFVACVITLAVLFITLSGHSAAAILTLIGISVTCLIVIKRQLGGYTGDTLGFCAQLTEAGLLCVGVIVAA